MGTSQQQFRRMSSAPPMLSPLQSGDGEIAPIYKFVLTGGPCAGKTTSLDRLSTFFRDRGFRVYVVPEASTLLQTGGAFFLDLKEKDILNFQWQIMKLQMTMEDSFYSLAQDSGKPCVLLCDRGTMDGAAYMTTEQWEELKAQHDLDTVTLRDTRYIAVFHLVTAADGAEKFYTLENNGIRIESVEQAREVDARTCRVWTGHPKLFIFDNSTGFESKMQRLVDTAAGLCGIPTTVKASRKFLLKRAPLTSDIPIHHEDFEVEKAYLTPESAGTTKDYSFVRCRSQYGIPAYGMTTVRYLETGDSVHLKRVLSAREYAYAVRHRLDPGRFIIKQQRMCFLYKNQSFQIHIYKEPPAMAGLAILHIQASRGDDSMTLDIPSFLEIERELQEKDEEYSAYNVSLKVRGN
ncbi:hypothetical protein Poli38472_005892 [Pythium oligandrum]|uniref:NadR/Ttd14 AAA domain-containing protein n=1 Tax=Pythium oligandrum TaxID=41045 RepID=A0A8K1CRV2_PYTOL|nr:hypothetical protein Poli38472_005892 [Pythium oligandrum]|eukprot:TMW68424.1 hypothetical protein Poli38472_005892 [Pythium oligandrum]